MMRDAACAMMRDAEHLRPRPDPRALLPVKVVLRCAADHAHAHHHLSGAAAREALAGELLDGALGVHADHRATASRASPLSARARSCRHVLDRRAKEIRAAALLTVRNGIEPVELLAPNHAAGHDVPTPAPLPPHTHRCCCDRFTSQTGATRQVNVQRAAPLHDILAGRVHGAVISSEPLFI